MFLNSGMLIRVVLLIGALYWCKEVFGRMRDDVALVKDGEIDAVRKAVIIGVWLLTVVIMTVLIAYVLAVIITAVRAFH